MEQSATDMAAEVFGLTPKKPKYNIGDTVFTTFDVRIVERRIMGIFMDSFDKFHLTFYQPRNRVHDDRCPSIGHWESEDMFFPSKEELIKSLSL